MLNWKMISVDHKFCLRDTLKRKLVWKGNHVFAKSTHTAGTSFRRVSWFYLILEDFSHCNEETERERACLDTRMNTVILMGTWIKDNIHNLPDAWRCLLGNIRLIFDGLKRMPKKGLRYAHIFFYKRVLWCLNKLTQLQFKF